MSDLFDIAEATWPPAQRFEVPGFVLRDGAGGGKRVSAATPLPGWQDAHIREAETGMFGLGQRPLFMLKPGEERLDMALADRGYHLVDPVVILSAPIAALDDRPIPPVTAFAVPEPLAIMREIWARGGIGPARLAVMARAEGPATTIFGRVRDKPAGCAFAAVSQGTAMVHAVEVVPALRRNGLGLWMMRAAAKWARGEGAERIAILVTRANHAANALYASLGMTEVGEYHYRMHPEEET